MPEIDPAEIDQLLATWSEGDREALARLVPIVYHELRKLARQQMHKTPSVRTL